MNYLNVLAAVMQTDDQARQTAQESIVPLDLIWEQIISLNILEALMFISFGVVCLFYGWRVFKILVVISFALLGMVGGMMISEKISGENHAILGAVLGMVALAILSVPLMRWAVSILGAVAGGVITSGIWYACQLNERYMIAGAIIGIIAGGMISFIVFRVAVMLFSSLGGSALVVVGMLAVLYLYPPTMQKVEEIVFTERWFLPLILTVPTAIGIIVQNKFVKGSKDWSV